MYCCCVLVCIRNSNFVNQCIIAGVHDSYWTHACDVEEMNRILREKFVELYETPILENVKYLHLGYLFLFYLVKCHNIILVLVLFLNSPFCGISLY